MKKIGKKEIGSKCYLLCRRYVEGPSIGERVITFQAYNEKDKKILPETVTVMASDVYFLNKNRVLRRVDNAHKNGLYGYLDPSHVSRIHEGPKHFVQIGMLDANRQRHIYYFVPRDNIEMV